MSKVLKFALAASLAAALSVPAASSEVKPVKIEDAMAWERLPDENPPPYFGPTTPLDPEEIADYPGVLLGTTHYDYQTNSSSGNRMAIDADGGRHFIWMNGIGTWAGNRWVYYNYIDADGQILQDGGLAVNTQQGAGYCQLDALPDGRAATAYHNVVSQQYTLEGIDAIPGFGSFTEFDPDDIINGLGYIWPYQAIDRQGRIQILACGNLTSGSDPKPIAYMRSDDEGQTWTDLTIIDTVMVISGNIVSSKVDDKVAIVYCHPRNMLQPDQYNNDVIYIESQDGVNWDFGDKINITNYDTFDSLRAYCDLDAIYDLEGDLHILWNTPYYDEIGGFITVDACSLWHWSDQTGITFVADGWWPSNPGAWNRSISKMNLGVDNNNNLFAEWTQFNDVDVSQGTFSNGELYMNYSVDGGFTWSVPENMTNSPSPGCIAGECESDHWSSMNEMVNDSLHILFINDKDAGGIPQTEGTDTENPVYYMTYPNPVYTGLEESDGGLPRAFGLKRVYPNPFNASTVVEFTLGRAGEVEMTAYNLIGEKVATLHEGYLEAGVHTVRWDAGELSSGVYFLRLSSEEGVSTVRALLVK